MRPHLPKLASDLTEKFLLEPGSEGFGYRDPDVLVVYVQNKQFASRISEYLSHLDLEGISVEIKTVGKTFLLGRKHGA